MPAAERGEPRTPVVAALLIAMCLPPLMPDHFLPLPRWAVSAVIGCFLVAMVVSDPGRIDRRSIDAHKIRIGLVIVLVGSAAWSTAALTSDLIFSRKGVTDTASGLLQAGGLVWLSLMISFSFLYWELDRGGPGARTHDQWSHPDLAFPQDLSPEVSPEGWRPTYVDYAYVGVTNGVAFSPTDAMPLAHWAKLAMAIQSVTSLMIIGLVVARAVNVLQ